MSARIDQIKLDLDVLAIVVSRCPQSVSPSLQHVILGSCASSNVLSSNAIQSSARSGTDASGAAQEPRERYLIYLEDR